MKTKKPTKPTPKSKKRTPRFPSGSATVVGILPDGTRLDQTLMQLAPSVMSGKDRTVVVTSDSGEAHTGFYGCAISGYSSLAVTKGGGLAYVVSGTAKSIGARGFAINRSGKTPYKAPDQPRECFSAEATLLAYTCRGGKAKAADAGIAIAINEKGDLTAAAQATPGGLIILGYTDQATGQTKYVPVQVDGVKIKGNTLYKLDQNHQPVEVPPVTCVAKPKC